MKLQFVDINNPPRPSTVFNNCEELREALDNLRNSGALMFELWGNNGYKLGIGLDSAIGCVQFSGIDHDPPYFMALANSPVSQESHSFPMNGSATEVRNKHCLPSTTVYQIACYFLETGERSPEVEWEEV